MGKVVGALATDAANRSARRRRGDSAPASALAGGDDERAPVDEESATVLLVVAAAVAVAAVPRLLIELVRVSVAKAAADAVAIAGALLRFSFCESTMARTL